MLLKGSLPPRNRRQRKAAARGPRQANNHTSASWIEISRMEDHRLRGQLAKAAGQWEQAEAVQLAGPAAQACLSSRDCRSDGRGAGCCRQESRWCSACCCRDQSNCACGCAPRHRVGYLYGHISRRDRHCLSTPLCCATR